MRLELRTCSFLEENLTLLIIEVCMTKNFHYGIQGFYVKVISLPWILYVVDFAMLCSVEFLSHKHSFHQLWTSTIKYLALLSLCKTLNFIQICNFKEGTTFFQTAVNLIGMFSYINLDVDFQVFICNKSHHICFQYFHMYLCLLLLSIYVPLCTCEVR